MNQLIKEVKILLRSIPSGVTALFAISVIAMNLLANKSIALPVSWLALDAGFLFSWIAFLTMDIVTRRFGPRAATLLSLFITVINLGTAAIFYIASSIPGVWGESFVTGSEAIINTALDHTFGGTWYVLLGSTIAFLLSAAVNNFSNWSLGKLVHNKPNSFGAYAFRSYTSTFIGQFVDNLTFAFIVSHNFFGWSFIQCITCAITGALFELFCEIVFSPTGYRISNEWVKEDVGREYLDYAKANGKEYK